MHLVSNSPGLLMCEEWHIPIGDILCLVVLRDTWTLYRLYGTHVGTFALCDDSSIGQVILHTGRGRAIVQAVSRRLPTAAARDRSQVRICGNCGGQSGTGAGFLRVLRFPLPILIPPTTPHSSSIIRGWNNRPNIGRRTSGLSLTPPQEKLAMNLSH
jgi:hypothetical protein